ncbi:ovarian cancer G-protein coupled receptor 1-like [Cheilinus undulatus]|uniref:ovarian cancer G-protein coupled receptor 1-like n=1 Tax=Cheilinus undulatus TaxID=241271 RepID=UPI001BD32933|nr:ovarian cancer G-protein coupled receptor 1-like [Cheilinus undulatus]
MANISVNTTLLNESINFNHNGSLHEDYGDLEFIMHVVTCIIICIGLPLLLMAIYALYSLVKNGQVAPIYIINLLISDLIQLCCLIVWESKPEREMTENIVRHTYRCGLMTSVGFMVCISLERYLLIAHPLWYRFRRTIRISVAVCVVVWIIPLVLSFAVLPWVSVVVKDIIFAIFLIIPFPLFIFFLVGTLRALSTSVSVPSDEKRRIVAILVLVLLIYTLLFLPRLILFTAETHDFTLNVLSLMFLKLSPLADLLLYVFIKKETFGKLWSSVCCCRKENNDTNNTNTINLDHTETSGYQLGGRSQKVAD